MKKINLTQAVQKWFKRHAEENEIKPVWEKAPERSRLGNLYVIEQLYSSSEERVLAQIWFHETDGSYSMTTFEDEEVETEHIGSYSILKQEANELFGV